MWDEIVGAMLVFLAFGLAVLVCWAAAQAR
jgi:hypothetical protein